MRSADGLAWKASVLTGSRNTGIFTLRPGWKPISMRVPGHSHASCQSLASQVRGVRCMLADGFVAALLSTTDGYPPAIHV